MTKPIGEPPICCWCHSSSIGRQPHLLQHKRPMGWIIEPEDKPITIYERLQDGFDILYKA
jgi:hypothetical protein